MHRVLLSPPADAMPTGTVGERSASRPRVHFIVVTGDPLAKLAPVLRELVNRPSEAEVTVLSGCAVTDDELTVPGIRLLRFPGETPFDLRRRVPEVAGDVEWVLLLEDHNHVDRAWLGRALASIAAAPKDATTVRGGADNLTSTDPWSWANFLMVLGFHWTPLQSEAVEPLFFNVALRRARLLGNRLDVGEFEVKTLALLEEQPAAGDFPVDHVQFRRTPGVFFYHWCNGRVTGSAMRRHHPDGWWHVLRHAKRIVCKRTRQLGDVVRRHPAANRLPAGTLSRVAILSFCHAAGAIYGGIFGVGNAARHLE
jgi:hypothetical protein